jgi:hypothetical protein
MVIGMGASILIARRGRADAPFMIIDKSCSHLKNLSVPPLYTRFITRKQMDLRFHEKC